MARRVYGVTAGTGPVPAVRLKCRFVAYVITQPCIGVKDASCVEVCPVDCIHTDDAAEMYYIDPEECIDCGACVDPCPVDAIFPEDEVPGDQTQFIKINADYFKK
jgi:NAD-dependent dihydropyrimidine dehydrogenase PreA subunit